MNFKDYSSLLRAMQDIKFSEKPNKFLFQRIVINLNNKPESKYNFSIGIWICV